MNIISFDIEEWYIEKKFNGARREKYQEFDHYLSKILNILDKYHYKATFFCLGKIATDFPYVVKTISEHGHEIGCHSNEHLWLTKMSPDILQKDTTDALKALEDVSGQKVLSYRAPAFSIGENNKWAIEVLAECGIQRDASIFPAKRDFGGFYSFPMASPVKIEYNGSFLREFPICLTRIFGYELAYSGGGYFRLFPYQYIYKKIIHSDYAICYFHIGDLLHNKGCMITRQKYETYFKEPGTIMNRMKRNIKSNLGTKGALKKMDRLIDSLPFISIEEADKIIEWDSTLVINL